MKAIKQIILFSIIGLLMVSCATSGPKYSEMADSTPQLTGANGRVYIYRTSALGAAIQPDVVLDGTVVGKAVAKGFFYVDCAAGNHRIATSTEVERELTFGLDEGQTRYVRLDVSMGFFVGHVYPNLVEPEEAKSEIENCHYIGEKSHLALHTETLLEKVIMNSIFALLIICNVKPVYPG
jgi:hypothetical protein